MQNALSLPEYAEPKDYLESPSTAQRRSFDLCFPARHDYTSLCIPCALTNHDFKQRMPNPMNGAMTEEHTPRAWVDNRPYRMVYRPFPRSARCTDCGEHVYIVYSPE
ncbi:MAG: hypothetical protein H6Q55_3752 [Deltaproteobacteria bacterium]|nr:hypothetical protein [Deltaproteobacteria bacterium]